MIIKKCLSCGKQIEDNSRSKNKNTCSPKCRRDNYTFRQPSTERFERLMRLRINTLKLHGGIITEFEIKDAKIKLVRGCCDICGPDIIYKFRQLHIDHNHENGHYRGVLCVKHNVGLREKVSLEEIQRMKNYLEQNELWAEIETSEEWMNEFAINLINLGKKRTKTTPIGRVFHPKGL